MTADLKNFIVTLLLLIGTVLIVNTVLMIGRVPAPIAWITDFLIGFNWPQRLVIFKD